MFKKGLLVSYAQSVAGSRSNKCTSVRTMSVSSTRMISHWFVALSKVLCELKTWR